MSGRHIPLPLKRILRQEAHFGCVLCGSPIIEYHHIIPFHKVKKHEEGNLVVLCPEHHHRANCGEIPPEILYKAKVESFNLKQDWVSKDFFLSNYSTLQIKVGSNIFVRTPKILVVDNHPLITIVPSDEGHAILNAKFYNRHNKLLAEIVDNEWKAYKNPDFWDVQYSPGHLIIHRDKGNIFLELKLSGSIVELRGNMYFNGLKIDLLPNKNLVGTNTISNCSTSDCARGITITTRR